MPVVGSLTQPSQTEHPEDEIKRLHTEIGTATRMTLEKAMRIGELLTSQKERLGHGNFTPWIEANLPFTSRTASNYMRLFEKRGELKSEIVSDLMSAYRFVAGKANPNPSNRVKTGFSDADDPPDDPKTYPIQIGRYTDQLSSDEKQEFDLLIRRLMQSTFHTNSMKQALLEALRFAFKEHNLA